MTDQRLQIVQAFTYKQEPERNALYAEAVHNTLMQLLPKPLLDSLRNPEIDKKYKEELLDKELPFLHHTAFNDLPCHISFFVLSHYRSSSFKFFFEMISRWLIPGKRLNVVLIYASDFYLPQISEQLYTLCEIMVRIDVQEDLEAINQALPLLDAEIRLGTESAYYARRILEVRGMSMDEKAAQIHEQMVHLVERFPSLYNSDLYNEMQHFMVTCYDGFKKERSVNHLSRLIAAYSHFRRKLREASHQAPNRRHLFVKTLPGSRTDPGSDPKPVLGLLIAVHFANDAEGIEKSHIYHTLQHYLPGAVLVTNSFLIDYRAAERTSLLYLEVEHPEGSLWSLQQLNLLRSRFARDLQYQIQQPIHSLFNPRNEEEMMRNLLALSQQLEHPQDLPQLFLSFEEQSYTHLFFVVLLVRIQNPDLGSLQEQFASSFLTYLPEQHRILGRIRKKYVKEAIVFQVGLEKQVFVRPDQSIDLIEARQQVFLELQRILGELRDYNGGMISKQSQILDDLRQLLRAEKALNPFFLDRFFYSLTPTITRHTFPLPILLQLYRLMMESIEKQLSSSEKAFSLMHTETPSFLYIVLIIEDPAVQALLQANLQTALTELKIPSTSLATTSFRLDEEVCLGYIYRGENASIRQSLLSCMCPMPSK